jgi:hypothetical protein
MLQPATRTNRDPFLARPLEPAVAHHTMTTRSVYCCAQAHLIPISLDCREAMCSLRRMPRCRHYHSGSVLEDTLSLTHDNTGAFSPCQQWTRRFHLAKRQAVPSETAALACHPQVKHQARSMPIGLVNNCMALKFAKHSALVPITVGASEKTHRAHFPVRGTSAETR